MSDLSYLPALQVNYRWDGLGNPFERWPAARLMNAIVPNAAATRAVHTHKAIFKTLKMCRPVGRRSD
jgi:hypothetical protein